MTPPTGRTEWRVHLGAHKTATTHLQDTLAACRVPLAAAGVDYLPRDAVRLPLSSVLARRRWQYWTGGRPMARLLRATLAPLRLGPPVVALSEENLLGEVGDALDPRPYPALGRRIAALRTLAADGDGLTLFLAVRSFARLAPSAYAQALLIGPVPRARLEAVAARPPSWREVIGRIEAAAPGVTLRVWRYEDYRAGWRSALAAFLSRDPGAPPELADPSATRSPPAATVAALEALDTRLSARDWRRRAKALHAEGVAGGAGERYAPFDAATTARLEARYAEDLDWIAGRPGMLLADTN